ncbi:Predicted DNA-binding transcriptional regulator YafY, contains an HTH and WYL domains [Williamsia sterculiae]|uniref:Predicted DNA-binding transcriptional regulator YafY, contains an HTH and WYL domains n=2 Tax=Williamsia sterculiae TaxID=1344003 RepID=A0A1N7GXW8_9NOCA|nr:Predicted DNA-binding transcriptional regulator YafY, contains an HTH and WYL domains [Williamsia sterculiae]
MTAAELAAELGVSERTVLRDIDALSLSGVPVYSERGRHGGFALVPGYRTDLSGLTLGEAIALLSGAGRIDSTAAASAKRKLEASLPDVHRGQVAAAAQRILVRPEGFVRAPEQLDALAPVQEAGFSGRRLRLMYRSRGGDPTPRVLDPIGLVVAGDVWYLVATVEGEERMYRVSRMSEVEVLDEVAERDPNVDLEEVWQRRRQAFRAGFESLEVTLDCAVHDVDSVAGHADVVESAPLRDGVTRVRLRFGDRRHVVRSLWSSRFDCEFDVIEPTWVRDELLLRARSV